MYIRLINLVMQMRRGGLIITDSVCEMNTCQNIGCVLIFKDISDVRESWNWFNKLRQVTRKGAEFFGLCNSVLKKIAN